MTNILYYYLQQKHSYDHRYHCQFHFNVSRLEKYGLSILFSIIFFFTRMQLTNATAQYDLRSMFAFVEY